MPLNLKLKAGYPKTAHAEFVKHLPSGLYIDSSQ